MTLEKWLSCYNNIGNPILYDISSQGLNFELLELDRFTLSCVAVYHCSINEFISPELGC